MDKMELSLGSGTFAVLEEQFNSVLNKTLGNMEMKGADTATVRLKLDIELDKESRDTGDGFKDFTLPKFKHSISSVMQVKDKASGELTGDYAMEFDPDTKQYILKKIDDGQQDLFEQEDVVHDAEFEEVPELPEGTKGLPAPEDEAEADEEDNSPTEGEEGEEGASAGYQEGGQEPEEFRQFAWLQQFVGDTMNVTEAMGNFTVRNSRNKVVLSSATSPESAFYCPADKLKDHVGHALLCIGYGDEQLDRIAIECPDCGDVVYEMRAPWADTEDNEPDGESYGYEKPEEG